MTLTGLGTALLDVVTFQVRPLFKLANSAGGKLAGFIGITGGGYLVARDLMKEAVQDAFDLMQTSGGDASLADGSEQARTAFTAFLDVVQQYPLAVYTLDCMAVDVLGQVVLFMVLPVTITLGFMLFSFVLSMIARIKQLLLF